MRLSEAPVDWAGEVWDELLAGLTAKDNHLRSIAAQLLCNLAKSNREGIRKDFGRILAVTHDDRFVTARHTLLALWKVALIGSDELLMVQNALEARYLEAGKEKNGTLIRYDILTGLKQIFLANNDKAVRQLAWKLIDLEGDPKYQKKYRVLWLKK